MRAELEVLLDTLRVLKKEGATDVFVGEDSLEALRRSVAAVAEHSAADGFTVERARPRVPAPAKAAISPLPTSSPVKKTDLPDSRGETPARETISSKASIQEKEPPTFDFSVSEVRAGSVPVTGTNAERLAALCEQMLGDPVCNEHLHKGKKLVFGEGNPEADVFFCGEAPGADEETAGRPFVGPAGQLLTKMIAATGLSREQVYIGNIMKWRPELPTLYGNRPPTPDEMRYCLPYLTAQVEIIHPKVIVALGLTAVNGLLGFDPDRRIGVMRGKNLEFRGVPVVATYHPSYLLRNDSVKSKRAAWEDFLRMMEIAALPVSARQRNFFLPKK